MKEWNEFLQNQVNKLGKNALDKWAKTLKVVRFDSRNLYLEAENFFQLHWFEEHLRPSLQKYFKNNNELPIQVHIHLPHASIKREKRKKEWIPSLTLLPDKLNPSFQLSSYFPGKSNACHFQLLERALNSEGFNPIYLQSPKEAGKTHLLTGSALYLQKKQNKSCIYMKATTLTQHVVAAIRSSNMQKLRDFYRGCDVLLIDDVEELADRHATQEELFHTFNALHLSKKQIFLASVLLPHQLQRIEPRLTSRFEWGLTLSFQPLNFQERQGLLQTKIDLPKELYLHLCKKLPSTSRLLLAAELLKDYLPHKLTVTQVDRLISTLVVEEKKKSLSPEVVLKIVADTFSLKPLEILGRSQIQKHCTARQIGMYFLRVTLKLPFTKIGKIFSRDHSTVISSTQAVQKKLEKQHEQISLAVKSIEAKLKSL